MAVLWLSACDAQPPKALHGYLLFGAGQYLGQLSLASGDARPAANLGDFYIEHVSLLDNGELLLSVSTAGTGRGRFRILRFHPIDWRSSTLLTGRRAHYLRDSNIIVYDNGLALIAVSRRNVRGDATMIQSHVGHAPTRFVALGAQGVLVWPSEDMIRRYDPKTRQSEDLTELSRVCRPEGAVWLAKHERLLCRSKQSPDSEASYLLVSLDGWTEGALPLPANRQFRAVGYVADQDLVILNETRRVWHSRRERHPVWAYELSTGELHAVAENQYLGSSVVYRRFLR